MIKLPVIPAKVMTHYDGKIGTYVMGTRDVEVLSINLNRRVLQVRYTANVFGDPDGDTIQTPHIKFSAVDLNDLRRFVDAHLTELWLSEKE